MVGSGKYRWVRAGERELIAGRLAVGDSPPVIARDFGCSCTTVRRVRDEVAVKERCVSPRLLGFWERERISRGVAAGETDSEIARALGRHRSTIGREIRAVAGEDRGRYRALEGERQARERAKREKPGKLSGSPALLAAVEEGLKKRWSPKQISQRLRSQYPDDMEMRISHETIYRSLYVQARGELRRELTRYLRTGRTKRKQQGTVDHRGKIPEMIMISERPAEIEDRAVPGHWEGDLIIGKANRSAVATLVERQTRYVLLARLGTDRSSETVCEALKQQIRTLPKHLTKSLTWDQGKELTAHRQLTIDTGIQIYFCDPRSPWQRGTNENTNGLLRQYLPKSSDLSQHTQQQLNNIAHQLNERPRQTLDWYTPSEKMKDLLLQ